MFEVHPHPNGPRLFTARRALAALAVLAALGACADQSFTVRYAPDFPKGGTNISVLGVFKDGRMSADSWDQLGAKLSASFRGHPCEAAYGDRLATASPALSEAVDDYTRANGVTDDLLDQLGPMAKGDTILLVTISGHPPQPLSDGGTPAARPARSSSMRGGGRRGRGQLPLPSDDGRGTDRSVFELSASLFSIRQHRSVALVGMSYGGPSVDEALKKFADKLAVEMPDSSCSGWNWDTPLSEEPIRKLLAE